MLIRPGAPKVHNGGAPAYPITGRPRLKPLHCLGNICPDKFADLEVPIAPTAPQDATLTEGLVDLLARPIDDATRQRASLHVLDWVGCAVAGAAGPIGAAAAGGAAMYGPGNCTVLGSATGVAPFGAAFLNGMFGNPLEMDDIHRTSTLHPGPVVVPAALAAAQHSAAPAPRFLDALVKGYEAVIRVGRSVGPGHYAKWHNTSTCGPFGAAAAVGAVLDLSREPLVWALGNAGAQSAGPWRCRHEPGVDQAAPHRPRRRRRLCRGGVGGHWAVRAPRHARRRPRVL